MSRHLLVVGAQRCGTSYLRSVLDAHPQITMARPARPEPKVFCSDRATSRGLAWYVETYFAHAGPGLLLGEKSTSYLEDPAAPARAARVLGAPHVLVLLRDPVQRAVSNWRFSTESGLETRPLEDALLDNLSGARPWDPEVTSVSPFAYLERGRYADHLAPWTQAFPATTHVHFLPELVHDDAALEVLWRDLGVDPGFRPPDRGAAVNRSGGEPPTLSAGTAGRLAEYFEPSNRALSSLLGRDLPWWHGSV